MVKTFRLTHLLVPLALAALLFAAPAYLQKSLTSLKISKCDSQDLVCVLFGDMMREVTALQWDLKRERFDKQTLPVLQIYLTDGALQKLYEKRRMTLDKPGQILIGEDDDWVSASVIADDGGVSQKLSASLRLKGDWVDHIKHPTKLSFRIKVRKQGYVFGMKRFSIQHPMTRKHQAEPLFMDEMRRWGILAPRYQFVDVRINDYNIGVMALEEHFSKELLESQLRREGPIVILNEDLMWRQRDLNMRIRAEGNPEGPGQNSSHIFMRDLPVKQFRVPGYAPGTTATTNSVRAMSFYRDFMDGRLPAEEVFDLEKLAHWWVLINAWYGCHGDVAHNRRFYFNPTANLMEPIAFDNAPAPYERTPQTPNCDPLTAPYLLDNPEFQNHVLDFSDQLWKNYMSEEWQDSFRARQTELLNILALEDLKAKTLYTKDILNNLAWFLDNIEFKSLQKNHFDKAKSFARTYPDAPLYSHVRAFLYPRGDGMTLQIKNLTAAPLTDMEVILNRKNAEPKTLQTVEQLLPFRPGVAQAQQKHIIELPIAEPYQDGLTVSVRFKHKSETVTEDAILQFREHISGFDSNFIAALSGLPGVAIDNEKRHITFSASEHVITHSIALGKGWSVTLEAGAKLTIKNGATVKIRGPLYALGTEQAPVRVHVEPSLTFQGVGAWGGILVLQAKERSRVQHAVMTGEATPDIGVRQDYYGITGCISFYESDVDITDTVFEDMHCEDALNIVRADFTLDRSTIRTPRADGFDSDFSVGHVTNSLFEETGNDAVDVSGTTLKLDDVRFINIGDKAVSVGEESTLEANRLTIDGSSSGVASKDLSFAKVNDSSFDNIGSSALITYIKKAEYGSATIECEQCTFGSYSFLATNQKGSRISINGEPQPVTKFNRKQLLEAGFAQ